MRGVLFSADLFDIYVCGFFPYSVHAVCAGPIPKELGNLSALTMLYFDRNNLSGESCQKDLCRTLTIALERYLDESRPRVGGVMR